MNQSARTDLGYLGEEYQYKLVHEFMADKEFFNDLSPIIEQNMFTSPDLRQFIGVMKDYAHRNGDAPSYAMMEIELNNIAVNDIQREKFKAICDKVHKTPSEGSAEIQKMAIKFFRQQNIIKSANEILSMAANGESDNFDKSVEIMQKALSQGVHNDMGTCVFDGVEGVLADDYREPIPTGIQKIDEVLEGGIGKGELGVIIGPSSFGKVQPYDAVIKTPTGDKRMRDIVVGSEILGSNGKAIKVLNVFPHRDWSFYRVKFDDGSSTECGLEHLWAVTDKKTGERVTKSLDELVCGGLLLGNEYRYSIPTIDSFDEDKMLRIVNELSLKKVNDNLYEMNNTSENVECLRKVREELWSMGCYVSNLDRLGYSQSEWGKPVKIYTHGKDRQITSVSFSKVSDGQCIKVDASDELYATDCFILTHNTSMTTAMASYAAEHGSKVLQIIFEDQVKQIQRKHYARITGIEARNLAKPENKRLVSEQLAVYQKNYPNLGENLRIRRLPSGEKTAWDLERYIKKQINNGFRPDLVIVDYFECLAHKGSSSESEWDKEGKTMRKFESMTNELHIAFWIPLQGTKDSVNTEMVTMDKAGGSFKKIQIAHIVMSIARTMEDIDNCRANIAILKNRAGCAGKYIENVYFNNGTCRILTDNCYEGAVTEFANNGRKSEYSMQQNLAKTMF